ncbi:hypothetical protein UlMin_030414 [Ulmus minor]
MTFSSLVAMFNSGGVSNRDLQLLGACSKRVKINRHNRRTERGLSFFYVIFYEAVAIYGVIVAIILQTKLESVLVSQIYAPKSIRAGYAIFAYGIIVGFANLVCRLCVGIIGSSCALSDAQNSVFCSILFSSYVSLKSAAFNLGL